MVVVVVVAVAAVAKVVAGNMITNECSGGRDRDLAQPLQVIWHILSKTHDYIAPFFSFFFFADIFFLLRHLHFLSDFTSMLLAGGVALKMPTPLPNLNPNPNYLLNPNPNPNPLP